MDFKQAEVGLARALKQYQQGWLTLIELANKATEIISANYPEGHEPRGLPSFLLNALPPLNQIRRARQKEMLNLNLKFEKTGREIKEAAIALSKSLGERLEMRNAALDEFIQDRNALRSYLIRSSKASWGHGGFVWPKDAIASERLEEIRQMCERIYDLEQDRQRLHMLIAHLKDEQVFQLTYDDLVSYGFQPGDESV